jgi:hypothetical protein
LIVRLYQTSRGRLPAKDVLAALEDDDADAWAKVRSYLWTAWEAETEQPRWPRDATEPVSTGLFAFRARGESLWVRVFYCYTQDRALVLLDGIYKKQNSFSPDQAQEYLKDFQKQNRSVVYWQSKPD